MSKQNPKPAKLHILEGNPNHRTKEQLKKKAESELHIGQLNFETPKILEKNKFAKKLWNFWVRQLKMAAADVITNCDSRELEKYCLSESEINRLEIIKQKTKDDEEIEKIQRRINAQVDSSLRLKKSLGLDVLSRLNLLKGKKEPKIDKKSKFEKQFGNI